MADSILLVERDAKALRVLKVSLEQAGYAVTTARNGLEALQELEYEIPACVITATRLGKLDGYGLVRDMKETLEWAEIPILFMTSDAESVKERVKGLELGVEEYIAKPVFVKELLSRVSLLLAQRVRNSLVGAPPDEEIAGSLTELAVIDLFESLEDGEKTCRVHIESEGGEGEVFFRDGDIVDAQLKRLRGEEAVYRMLVWTEGRFEVDFCEVDRADVVERNSRALFDAGMKHAAEYNRLMGLLPAATTPLVLNRDSLAAREDEIPAEIRGLLEMFDGTRSVLDVIDESPFDDLSTLTTMEGLYQEGLLLHKSDLAETMTGLGPDSSEPLAEEDEDAEDEDDDEAVENRPSRLGLDRRSRRGRARRLRQSVYPKQSTDPVDSVDSVDEAPTSDSSAQPSSTRTAQEEAASEEVALSPRSGGRRGAKTQVLSTVDPTGAAASTARGGGGAIANRAAPDPEPTTASESKSQRHAEASTEPNSAPPSSSVPRERRHEDEVLAPEDRHTGPPTSNPKLLSESGVSDHFFSTAPPAAPQSDPAVLSEDAPLYLTESQIVRKQKSMKLVGVTVGVLAVLALIMLLVNRSDPGPAGEPGPTARNQAASSGNRPADSSAKPSASPATSATAAPSASAVAAGAGGAGGAAGAADVASDDPRTVEELLAEAKLALNAGNYAKAVEAAKIAVDKAPEYADGYMVLWFAYADTAKRDEKAAIADACFKNAKKVHKPGPVSSLWKSYCKEKK